MATGLAASALVHLALFAGLVANEQMRHRPGAVGAAGGEAATVVAVKLSPIQAPDAAPSNLLAAIVRRSDALSDLPFPEIASPDGRAGVGQRGGAASDRTQDLDRLLGRPTPTKDQASAADPGDDLAAQIARCFTRAGSGIAVMVELGLDGTGGLTRPPIILRPPLATLPPERVEVEVSALNAVRQCAPYVGQGRAEGTARVTLK